MGDPPALTKLVRLHIMPRREVGFPACSQRLWLREVEGVLRFHGQQDPRLFCGVAS